MRSFITRIRVPQGNPADQSSLHSILSANPDLSFELLALDQKPGGLEIEYRTSGGYSISDLGRTISGAVSSVKKPSSFFIIREKKS